MLAVTPNEVTSDQRRGACSGVDMTMMLSRRCFVFSTYGTESFGTLALSPCYIAGATHDEEVSYGAGGFPLQLRGCSLAAWRMIPLLGWR